MVLQAFTLFPSNPHPHPLSRHVLTSIWEEKQNLITSFASTSTSHQDMFPITKPTHFFIMYLLQIL